MSKEKSSFIKKKKRLVERLVDLNGKFRKLYEEISALQGTPEDSKQARKQKKKLDKYSNPLRALLDQYKKLEKELENITINQPEQDDLEIRSSRAEVSKYLGHILDLFSMSKEAYVYYMQAYLLDPLAHQDSKGFCIRILQKELKIFPENTIPLLDQLINFAREFGLQMAEDEKEEKEKEIKERKEEKERKEVKEEREEKEEKETKKEKQEKEKKEEKEIKEEREEKEEKRIKFLDERFWETSVTPFKHFLHKMEYISSKNSGSKKKGKHAGVYRCIARSGESRKILFKQGDSIGETAAEYISYRLCELIIPENIVPCFLAKSLDDKLYVGSVFIEGNCVEELYKIVGYSNRPRGAKSFHPNAIRTVFNINEKLCPRHEQHQLESIIATSIWINDRDVHLGNIIVRINYEPYSLKFFRIDFGAGLFHAKNELNLESIFNVEWTNILFGRPTNHSHDFTVEGGKFYYSTHFLNALSKIQTVKDQDISRILVESVDEILLLYQEKEATSILLSLAEHIGIKIAHNEVQNLEYCKKILIDSLLRILCQRRDCIRRLTYLIQSRCRTTDSWIRPKEHKEEKEIVVTSSAKEKAVLYGHIVQSIKLLYFQPLCYAKNDRPALDFYFEQVRGIKSDLVKIGINPQHDYIKLLNQFLGATPNVYYEVLIPLWRYTVFNTHLLFNALKQGKITAQEYQLMELRLSENFTEALMHKSKQLFLSIPWEDWLETKEEPIELRQACVWLNDFIQFVRILCLQTEPVQSAKFWTIIMLSCYEKKDLTSANVIYHGLSLVFTQQFIQHEFFQQNSLLIERLAKLGYVFDQKGKFTRWSDQVERETAWLKQSEVALDFIPDLGGLLIMGRRIREAENIGWRGRKFLPQSVIKEKLQKFSAFKRAERVDELTDLCNAEFENFIHSIKQPYLSQKDSKDIEVETEQYIRILEENIPTKVPSTNMMNFYNELQKIMQLENAFKLYQTLLKKYQLDKNDSLRKNYLQMVIIRNINPLFLALLHGQRDIARDMLKDVPYKFSNGLNITHMLFRYKYHTGNDFKLALHTTEMVLEEEIFKNLLIRPFHLVILSQNDESVKISMIHLLATRYAWHIDAVDGAGNTPLHIAILRNEIHAAFELISNGASLYICNNFGQSSLALLKNNLPAEEFLMPKVRDLQTEQRKKINLEKKHNELKTEDIQFKDRYNRVLAACSEDKTTRQIIEDYFRKYYPIYQWIYDHNVHGAIVLLQHKDFCAQVLYETFCFGRKQIDSNLRNLNQQNSVYVDSLRRQIDELELIVRTEKEIISKGDVKLSTRSLQVTWRINDAALQKARPILLAIFGTQARIDDLRQLPLESKEPNERSIQSELQTLKKLFNEANGKIERLKATAGFYEALLKCVEIVKFLPFWVEVLAFKKEEDKHLVEEQQLPKNGFFAERKSDEQQYEKKLCAELAVDQQTDVGLQTMIRASIRSAIAEFKQRAVQSESDLLYGLRQQTLDKIAQNMRSQGQTQQVIDAFFAKYKVKYQRSDNLDARK